MIPGPSFSCFAVFLVVLANLLTSLGFRLSCRVNVDLTRRVKRFGVGIAARERKIAHYVSSSMSQLEAQELPLPPGRSTRRFPLNLFSDDTLRLLNPKSMARYQLDRQQQYGEVFRTSIFFMPTVVATSDAALQDLGGREASARMKAFFPPHHQKLFGPSSLLVTSGPKHDRIRRLMAGSLSPTIVSSSYRPLIEASIERFFVDLKNSSSISDAYQPMVPRMRSFFIQLMLQVVLGAEDSNRAEVEDLASDIEIWSRGLLAPPLTFIPWSTAGRAMRARKRIASTLRDWMMNGSSSSGTYVHEGGVLNKLMLAKDEDGVKLSEEEIIDNVLTLLFAGSDTTASAAISLWKVLSEDPHRESLQRELLDSSDDELEQFVLNVLAKYPPAPFGMRLNGNVDTEIGGYRLPAGWLVVYGFAGALLSRPEPELSHDWRRAKEEQPGDSLRASWTQFGTGPRQCPGRFLANLELKVLARKLASLQWTLDSGQNLEQRYTPGFFPVDEFRVKLS